MWSRPIEVVDYDPKWAGIFAEVAASVRGAFTDGPLLGIEHVGSTSVVGLPAKPIVDIDIVIPSRADLPEAIVRLATLGYTRQGDLGITSRESFRRPLDSPLHNLYVCAEDSPELRRHLLFRNYLRAHPYAAEQYGELKRELAARYVTDIDAYVDGKTEFIQDVLTRADAREQMNEVVIVDYNPSWPDQFAEEAGRIKEAVGPALVAVEHVGSTAIPGLAAKPVLDILAGVTSLDAGRAAVPALEALGYECRGENGIPGRLYFRKGTVQHRHTHHLHMVELGHEQWAPMLAFRDTLRAHPETARQYEQLKRDLAVRFRDNRPAYTDGKADFVQKVVADALAERPSG